MGKKEKETLKKRVHSKEEDVKDGNISNEREDWKHDKSYPSKSNVLRELIPAVLIGIVLYFAYPYIKQAHNPLKKALK
jgi:F0F1-type ATP synthase assembly protein I